MSLSYTFVISVYLLAAVSLSMGEVDKEGANNKHPTRRCYDCSFHYSKGGYHACELPTEKDGTDKWSCEGRCFIRQDFNGYVYRGCASPSTFPAIDTSVIGCSHQGRPRTLWLFCDDDLCNHGNLLHLCGPNYHPKHDYFPTEYKTNSITVDAHSTPVETSAPQEDHKSVTPADPTPEEEMYTKEASVVDVRHEIPEQQGLHLPSICEPYCRAKLAQYYVPYYRARPYNSK